MLPCGIERSAIVSERIEGRIMESSVSDQSYLLGETKDAVYRYHLFNQIHEPATRDRLTTLDIAPNAYILEVGCGIGETAFLFATELVPEGHVIAFDRAADLVEIARQRAAERGIANITFVCASAQEFDFGLDQFDLVHSRFVLSYMSDAAAIVDRILRAINPGGIFFGEEVVQSYVLDGNTALYEQMMRGFAKLIEAGGGNPNYGMRQLPSDMLAAGFPDLRATAHWPMQTQSTIAEMLSLVLSREMKPNFVKLGIATEDEVDAVVDALGASERDFTISTAMVAQVIAQKP